MKVNDLIKRSTVRDFKAFRVLVDIMKGLLEYSMDERVEAAFHIFMQAYYSAHFKYGLLAFETLLANIKSLNNKTHNSKSYYTNLMVNAAFYIQPIPSKVIYNMKQKNFDQSKSAFNPFMLRDHETGHTVIGCRCAHPSKRKGTFYDIFVIDTDGIILSITPMQFDFNFKKYMRLNFDSSIEDIRVFEKSGEYYATATTMDTHFEGPIRMSLFHLRFQRTDGVITMVTGEKLVPLRGYEDDQNQKNWLPFEHEGQIHFVYKTDPLTILRLPSDKDKVSDKATDKGEVVKVNVSPGFPKIRGNTPPIPYKGKWLYLGHCNETRHRIYYHRFIEMNRDFTLSRVSSLFYFERANSIEFAVNMIPGKEGHYLISYGVQDKYARVCEVAERDIEAAFSEHRDFVQFTINN